MKNNKDKTGIGCSIRPFDCAHYKHEHLCGEAETTCKHSKNLMSMTRQEIKEAMDRGCKVRHEYFSPHEWAKKADGLVVLEDGVKCSPSEFWGHRTQSFFDNGWSIIEEAKTTQNNSSDAPDGGNRETQQEFLGTHHPLKSSGDFRDDDNRETQQERFGEKS